MSDGDRPRETKGKPFQNEGAACHQIIADMDIDVCAAANMSAEMRDRILSTQPTNAKIARDRWNDSQSDTASAKMPDDDFD